MKPRHLLVAIGMSALLALAACEQSTTNSGGPGGYPGHNPGGAGPSSSSTSPMGSGGSSAGSMSSGSGSGSSASPMR